jgi:hypothetical protein
MTSGIPSTDVRCPRCGGPSVPIVYGLPGGGMFEAADRGEIALGGCCVTDQDPDRACRGIDCGLEFVE